MSELDELHRATIHNVRLLSKWAREFADAIDKLNGTERCEHCGMTAEVCRCYDDKVAA